MFTNSNVVFFSADSLFEDDRVKLKEPVQELLELQGFLKVFIGKSGGKADHLKINFLSRTGKFISHLIPNSDSCRKSLYEQSASCFREIRKTVRIFLVTEEPAEVEIGNSIGFTTIRVQASQPRFEVQDCLPRFDIPDTSCVPKYSAVDLKEVGRILRGEMAIFDLAIGS